MHSKFDSIRLKRSIRENLKMAEKWIEKWYFMHKNLLCIFDEINVLFLAEIYIRFKGSNLQIIM